jgi:hypothetical protein
MKKFAILFGIVGVLGFSMGCGDVCTKSCKKMKKCAAEMKLGDKFEDTDKCIKECKKEMKKDKNDMKAAEKCLKKDSCKEYFGCLMEAATKDKK